MKIINVQVGQSVSFIKMPKKYKKYYRTPLNGIVTGKGLTSKKKPLIAVRVSSVNFAYNIIYVKPAILKPLQ